MAEVEAVSITKDGRRFVLLEGTECWGKTTPKWWISSFNARDSGEGDFSRWDGYQLAPVLTKGLFIFNLVVSDPSPHIPGFLVLFRASKLKLSSRCVFLRLASRYTVST